MSSPPTFSSIDPVRGPPLTQLDPVGSRSSKHKPWGVPSPAPTWSDHTAGPNTSPAHSPMHQLLTPPADQRTPQLASSSSLDRYLSSGRSPVAASSSSASITGRPAGRFQTLSPPVSRSASGSAAHASRSQDNTTGDSEPLSARPGVSAHRHGSGSTSTRPAGFPSVPELSGPSAPLVLQSPAREPLVSVSESPSRRNAYSSSAPVNLSPPQAACLRYPLYLERSASPVPVPAQVQLQDPGSDIDDPSEAASAHSYQSMFQVQLTGRSGSTGESSRSQRHPYTKYITDDEAIEQARGQKRKPSYTHTISDDRHNKMRRSAEARLSGGSFPNYTTSQSQMPVQKRPDPMANMITITCFHPIVAQKSYGAEKRYFSPPPFVAIRGPLQNAPSQALEMNVITGRESGGSGDVESTQTQFLDGNFIATFRTLHVGGMSNRKRCQLRLTISDASTSDVPETVDALASRPFMAPQNPFYLLPMSVPTGARKWATFLSAPIAILSKPAKHMKSHDPSSITFGSTVSLYHRLNSQTARTKYVHINSARRMLETSGASWTPLVVERVDTPAGPGRPGGLSLPYTAPSFAEGFGSLPDPDPSLHTPRIAPLPQILDVRRLEVLAPVTFNSTITLFDPQTGVRSPPLIIKKVVNGHIKPDEPSFGDPLDPLNHLGASSTLRPLEPVGQLQKVAFMRPPQTYPRGRVATGTEPNMYWGTPPDSDEMMFGTPIQSGRPARAYRPRSRRLAAAMESQSQPEEPDEGLEELDDAVVWTIVSVTNFKYSYFASDPGRVIPPEVAAASVTPFPALRQEPFYRPQMHALQLLVDDFDQSLEIWVGSFGPLRVSLLRQGTDQQTRKMYDPRTWFEVKRPPVDQPAAEFAIGGGSLPERTASSVSPTASPDAQAGSSKTGPKPLRAKIPPALDVAKPQTVLQVDLPPILHLVRSCFRNEPAGNAVTDLPIIFMRTLDGTGFHSGKSIVVENILGEHCSRNDVAGWTVRVVSR
ncbi:hypothetical protein DACRYDRAFT_102198 [Dacryopinax primogenitus]|uniref:LAG1-DNAbind-domain-containing protein n=1 Tax=Dacryopinax primogenitus (strain DJM 731) TaxID=1858805 RepID=M5FNU1_DACPD|nr:uncharacterized protein DACRYDRAFT_102198 [Dacryopinax primogenitus]EJT97925.1 hypothetical protein DACRYDRAFT_102198 [Dacryopinax primogenitus]